MLPRLLTLNLAAAIIVVGQYPGQYPPGQYPPGQYPPGTYPGTNNPPVPLPGRGSRKSTTTDQKDAAAATRSFSGVIRVLEAKSFDLETEDTRILTFQITDKTTKPAELKLGDGVDVEATQDKEGLFQAVTVKPNAQVAATINGNDQIAVAPEGRTAAPPTIMAHPDQKYDQGDSGPPRLKRGMPADYTASGKKKESDDLPTETAPTPPPPPPPPPPVNPRMAFIEKARGAAVSYVEHLPNYICQEVVSRYVSETRVPSWSVVDTVSAEVVYENQKESYRNLAINGKPSKKAPEETGAWSTGEFGTVLRNLFDPGTDADFKFVQEDTIAHKSSSVYKFSVVRARSSWKIWVPGQYIIPAYKGSVWLDKENGNVLRIEMQAKEIPEEFPRITVESAVDYEYISLGTPEKFLLPVHAEVLSCDRNSNECDRNVIDFRNYHKFTGESVIKFGNQ